MHATSAGMNPDTRAMIAAVAFASTTGKTVAGLFDHAAGRDLRVAAERRGDQVKGFDGERNVAFAGTLPEIHDEGSKAFVSFTIDGEQVRGFDRASGAHFEARVGDGVVQVFDHAQSTWFAYDVQDAQAASSYLRSNS
ncbi:hypothetical protein [Novosphingobium sp. B-7]|nr:hypothetical protein [Novosphingobium sp. B-7]